MGVRATFRKRGWEGGDVVEKQGVRCVLKNIVARCARRRRVVGDVAWGEMSQHSERERRGTRIEREPERGEHEPGSYSHRRSLKSIQFLLPGF